MVRSIRVICHMLLLLLLYTFIRNSRFVIIKINIVLRTIFKKMPYTFTASQIGAFNVFISAV